MIFQPTKLPGAYLVELDRRSDERGFFARRWCRETALERGLVGTMVQANLAFNARCGTLRGLHFQAAPHQEVKVVRCARGAVYDVIVDLRPDSSTCRQWLGVELSEDNGRMLYVPEGFAHGYQTLTDAAEVDYLVSRAYAPGAERGVRFDDPSLGIDWPEVPCRIVSAKDRGWPDLPTAGRHG